MTDFNSAGLPCCNMEWTTTLRALDHRTRLLFQIQETLKHRDKSKNNRVIIPIHQEISHYELFLGTTCSDGSSCITHWRLPYFSQITSKGKAIKHSVYQIRESPGCGFRGLTFILHLKPITLLPFFALI